MSEIKDIVIDLINPKYGFSANELIHQNEFLTITKLIGDQLSEDENQNSSEDGCQNQIRFVFPNINRTIMLNGARGTGKTTFLQTVIRDLPNKTRDNKNGEKFCDSLEILDYLDPTLIEEKSSIFLTIISLIRNRVQDKLNKYCDKEIVLNKRRAWQTSLDKFARGLPSIDENTKNKSADYWDDATQIMEKGLEDVNAAFNLRKNFLAFLKESLGILGKKSFLLVIDDVDTDPGKAWPLLETLRKYLSVNGIITVVSGDLQLFATVVRNKQGSRFTKTDKNNSLVEAQIEELSNQYLKKVLPIRYRISLPRLSQLINNRPLYNSNKNSFDGEHLFVKYKDNEASIIPVKEFIRRVFYKLGIANNFQREGYTDFLLNLPLRTQIDWMRLFQNYGDEETFKINEPFEPEYLVSLFIDELLQNDIDINLLVYNPNFINSIIIDFLIDKDILSESYQLQATSKDSSVNAVLFSLSMILSRSILDKPSLIFDNLIKVGYLRNLKPLFSKNDNNYSFKSLTTHMGVTNDKDVRQMVCLATAYLRGMLKNKKLAGVIELSDAKFLLHKNEIELNDYIARLPYSNSMVGKGVHEYSLFTLLGAINDLIRDFESGDNLLKVLQRISQPREYAALSDYTYTENSEVNDENDDEESVVDDKDFETMRKELNDWLEDAKREKRCIASHVLAKVATRLYYTFNNIDISQEKTLGDAMHLYIIALFNSVIIEEVMELTAGVNSDFENIKITNRSVRSSPKVFINNLKAIAPALQSQKLPLTRIILTCPIFMFFIDFESNGNGSEELLKTYEDIKQNDFNGTFYRSKGCYSKLKDITQKGEIVGKESFTVKNFDNIIDIIKSQFSYDTFMNSEAEDFRNKLSEHFNISNPTYKRSLDKIRKKILDEHIIW